MVLSQVLVKLLQIGAAPSLNELLLAGPAPGSNKTVAG
jgi:hypothetical protein